MAFTETERTVNLQALKAFLGRRRPPEHILPELDIGYAIVGHTVDVFEIRPDWQDRTSTRHTPVARMRFVRTKGHWRLYWMRGDLKWHAYDPAPIHRSLASALQVVDEDVYCCFFG
ncbi:MAG: DUF3024 domain-containing protein [Lautropia sp.]